MLVAKSQKANSHSAPQVKEKGNRVQASVLSGPHVILLSFIFFHYYSVVVAFFY